MKHFIALAASILQFEEFLNLPISGFRGSKRSVSLLWETTAQKSFRLGTYLKSLNNASIGDALDCEAGYYRVLIYNSNPNFTIFVWGADSLHNDVSKGLTKNASELKLPNINFYQEYLNSMKGEFGDNWCFPVVYDKGGISTNIYKRLLIKFDHDKSVKQILKITDSQWQTILDEAF